MTVAVAAIHRGVAVIGADTQVVRNDRVGRTAQNFQKLVEFDHFICAFAGLGKVMTVVEEMARDSSYIKKAKPYLKLKNQHEVLAFTRDVWQLLNDQVENAFSTYPEEAKVAELLILTKSTIYRVDSFDEISMSDTFDSIGSGQDVAYGAMSVLYDHVDQGLVDLSKAVKKALGVACAACISCGEPVVVRELK